MASEGHNPSPPSWAEIAAASKGKVAPSPLVEGPMLSKLKETTSDFVFMDLEAKNRAKMQFQHSLYGKFFGKAPPFDIVKANLLARWEEFGEIFISDLPNGYLLIRCAAHKAMQRILFEGPWTVNGVTLQMAPWHPYFEPAFAKMNTAAIWIQLHNLPVDFWDGESLDTITSHFGRLLKIDDYTSSLSRSRFARVCVELDLSKPLEARSMGRG